MLILSNQRLLIAAFSLLCAVGTSGCQSPGGKELCSDNNIESIGTVTTSGLYAIPKVFTVSETGVPLANVVQASLRPAIRQGRHTTLFASARPATEDLTPATRGKPKLPPSELFLRFVGTMSGDVELEPEVIEDLAQEINSGDESELTFRFLVQQKQILSQGLIGGRLTNPQLSLARLAEITGTPDSKLAQLPRVEPSSTDFQTLFAKLDAATTQDNKLERTEIREIIGGATDNGLVVSAVEMLLLGPSGENPQPLIDAQNKQELSQRIHALLSFEFTEPIAADPEPVNSPAQNTGPQITSSNSTLIEQMTVVVRRAGSATNFIPLTVVESTSAGDILLNDGDRVEITSFTRTSLGLRNAFLTDKQSRKGVISLTGFLTGAKDGRAYKELSAIDSEVGESQAGAISDLMVVVIDNRGQQEKYWLPRSSDQFSNLSAPALDDVKLLPGDIVNVNAIELMPIVRKSQIAVRTRGLEAAAGHIDKQIRRLRATANSHKQSLSGHKPSGYSSKLGAADTVQKTLQGFSPF